MVSGSISILTNKIQTNELAPDVLAKVAEMVAAMTVRNFAKALQVHTVRRVVLLCVRVCIIYHAEDGGIKVVTVTAPNELCSYTSYVFIYFLR